MGWNLVARLKRAGASSLGVTGHGEAARLLGCRFFPCEWEGRVLTRLSGKGKKFLSLSWPFQGSLGQLLAPPVETQQGKFHLRSPRTWRGEHVASVPFPPPLVFLTSPVHTAAGKQPTELLT